MTSDHLPFRTLDEELRTLLHARARTITPHGDPITEIALRYSVRRRQRRIITVAGAAVTAVALVVAIAFVGPALLLRGPDGSLPASPRSTSVETVTDDTFASEVLQAEGPVVVNFTADWCEPCLDLAPVLEEIAREHADKVTLFRIDFDESRHTAEMYAITAVPTLVIFENGRVVKTVLGFTTKDRLLKELEDFI